MTMLTGSDGTVRLRLPIAVPAGARRVQVSFAGNSTVGAARAVAPVTLRVEKVPLRAVSLARGVQASSWMMVGIQSRDGR